MNQCDECTSVIDNANNICYILNSYTNIIMVQINTFCSLTLSWYTLFMQALKLFQIWREEHVMMYISGTVCFIGVVNHQYLQSKVTYMEREIKLILKVLQLLVSSQFEKVDCNTMPEWLNLICKLGWVISCLDMPDCGWKKDTDKNIENPDDKMVVSKTIVDFIHKGLAPIHSVSL